MAAESCGVIAKGTSYSKLEYEMATAYVLINCDLGAEQSVISQLKSIGDVREVHGTFGAYDVLAKISSEKTENIRETITWKIRKINQIRSTLTLMGIEGQE
jgi:DNA-binding Lrp family transcriptional regulator